MMCREFRSGRSPIFQTTPDARLMALLIFPTAALPVCLPPAKQPFDEEFVPLSHEETRMDKPVRISMPLRLPANSV
jgi:hypothetical protein